MCVNLVSIDNVDLFFVNPAWLSVRRLFESIYNLRDFKIIFSMILDVKGRTEMGQ